MARLPRLELPHLPHLVVQPVLPGQALVRDAQDVQALRAALLDAARAHGVVIHAYALMPAHFHVLATPSATGALGGFMQAVGRRYVAAYNRRHGRQGGLWAGRYRCTVLEAARYLLDAMVFIESWPWRLGRVASPLMPDPLEGTSLAHHLGQRTDPLVQDHALFWALGNTPFEREAAWRRRLEQGQGQADVERLSGACRAGWVLGGEAFVAGLQAQAPRRLVPKPKGRPRKLPAVSADGAGRVKVVP